MLIGYARASLEKQAIERQLDELAAAGVEPRNIFNEKITGTRRDREELNRMLGALQPGGSPWNCRAWGAARKTCWKSST